MTDSNLVFKKKNIVIDDDDNEEEVKVPEIIKEEQKEMNKEENRTKEKMTLEDKINQIKNKISKTGQIISSTPLKSGSSSNHRVMQSNKETSKKDKHKTVPLEVKLSLTYRTRIS